MPSMQLGQEKVVAMLPEEYFFSKSNILPMPEGYVPICPSPPLSPDLMSTSMTTGFFNLDVNNLESFDDALQSMESQNTTTGMVCSPPRICYQFNNFVRFSSPMATASTKSTTTHSSAVADFTMPAITPFTTPSITPCTTLVITHCTMPTTTYSPAFVPCTTPAVTPCTTPAITHSPAVTSSTTPATAPLPAAPTTPRNTIDEPPAKHQKKARCTHAGETDLPQPVAVFSGRGKQQCFQST
ncbi:hypothetical protein C8R48DRAFT_782989 [Suillus tomentosus]|nr:hypothetical protein C8R48DRAFT_782989 [Suillus tomentosus]